MGIGKIIYRVQKFKTYDKHSSCFRGPELWPPFPNESKNRFTSAEYYTNIARWSCESCNCQWLKQYTQKPYFPHKELIWFFGKSNRELLQILICFLWLALIGSLIGILLSS